MSDSAPEPPKGPTRWSIPSWRRIGDFMFTIAQLERSYQALKVTNDQLRDELKRLQRDVDRHSRQLDALMTFVQKAMDRQEATQTIAKPSDQKS